MHRPPYSSLLDRLLHNSVYDEETGCRLWLGKLHCKGYGQLTIRNGKPYPVSVYAHRVMWEIVNGPIPKGMTVDHLCVECSCIEPTHLQLVTRAENSHLRNMREFERLKGEH